MARPKIGEAESLRRAAFGPLEASRQPVDRKAQSLTPPVAAGTG